MFHREMIVTECKSGNTAPLDRIFWLTGVRNYTGATQAFLVRKGTKWNIKDFAKECGVQILDIARVAEIEAALKIGEDEWPGVRGMPDLCLLGASAVRSLSFVSTFLRGVFWAMG